MTPYGISFSISNPISIIKNIDVKVKAHSATEDYGEPGIVFLHDFAELKRQSLAMSRQSSHIPHSGSCQWPCLKSIM